MWQQEVRPLQSSRRLPLEVGKRHQGRTPVPGNQKCQEAYEKMSLRLQLETQGPDSFGRQTCTRLCVACHRSNVQKHDACVIRTEGVFVLSSGLSHGLRS